MPVRSLDTGLVVCVLGATPAGPHTTLDMSFACVVPSPLGGVRPRGAGAGCSLARDARGCRPPRPRPTRVPVRLRAGEMARIQNGSHQSNSMEVRTHTPLVCLASSPVAAAAARSLRNPLARLRNSARSRRLRDVVAGACLRLSGCLLTPASCPGLCLHLLSSFHSITDRRASASHVRLSSWRQSLVASF
jgi:hypothetical protein